MEQILAIFIYRNSHNGPPVPFGKRATMFSGQPPLRDIFREELSGQFVRKTTMDVDLESEKLTAEEELESRAARPNSRGKTLVLGMALSPLNFQLTDFEVSATDEARDELRMLMRDHVAYGLRLAELDYQPS